MRINEITAGLVKKMAEREILKEENAKLKHLLKEALEYIYYGNDEMSEELTQYYTQWYEVHKQEQAKNED